MSHRAHSAGCSRWPNAPGSVPVNGQGSLVHRQIAESVDHFMTKLARFEQTSGPFQAKHLFNALPLLGKPLIEIGAGDLVALFQPPMSFVPGFSLLPWLPVWGRPTRCATRS